MFICDNFIKISFEGTTLQNIALASRTKYSKLGSNRWRFLQKDKDIRQIFLLIDTKGNFSYIDNL